MDAGRRQPRTFRSSPNARGRSVFRGRAIGWWHKERSLKQNFCRLLQARSSRVQARRERKRREVKRDGKERRLPPLEAWMMVFPFWRPKDRRNRRRTESGERKGEKKKKICSAQKMEAAPKRRENSDWRSPESGPYMIFLRKGDRVPPHQLERSERFKRRLHEC